MALLQRRRGRVKHNYPTIATPWRHNRNMDEMDDLMREIRRSEAAEAMKEKAEGETEEERTMAERLKDYPKIQRETDLHGMSGHEARGEIDRFINSAQNQRIRTVKIITGKGLHSKHQVSVLPEVTEQKLAELKKSGLVLSRRSRPA